MNKIGVFDSGIGGLTNLFSLVDQYPNHYVYVADQKHSPYGVKSKYELLSVVRKVVDFLIHQQCDTIIIACNTVCANILDELTQLYHTINFIGVIKPTIDLINQSHYENILLIATPMTIESRAYLKNNSKNMICLATPKLVPAIEELDYIKIKQVLETYLKPYQNKVDAICLGCTHYPIIENEIKSILNVVTLNSIDALNEYVNFDIEILKLEIYTTANALKLQNQIKTIFKRNVDVKQLEEQNESYCVQ